MHVAAAVPALIVLELGQLAILVGIVHVGDPPREAERVQLRRPRRRHPRAGLAAVEPPLALPLVLDPATQQRVFGPRLRNPPVLISTIDR